MSSDNDSSEASVATSSSSSVSSSSSSSSSSSNSNKSGNDDSIGVPGLNRDDDNNGSESSDSSSAPSSHNESSHNLENDHEDDIAGILSTASKKVSTIPSVLSASTVSNDNDDADSSNSNSTSDSDTVQTTESTPVQPPLEPLPSIVASPSASKKPLYGNIGEDDDDDSEDNNEDEATKDDSTSDSDTVETSESIPIQPPPIKPAASNNQDSTVSLESANSEGPSIASASSPSIDSGEASQASDDEDDEDEDKVEEESESSDSSSDDTDEDESATSVSDTVLTELPTMNEVASSPTHDDDLSTLPPTEAGASKDSTSDSETVLTEPELKIVDAPEQLQTSKLSLLSTSSSNETSVSDTVLTEPSKKDVTEDSLAQPDTVMLSSSSSLSVRARDNKPENVPIHVKGDNDVEKKGKEELTRSSSQKSSKMDGSLSGLLDLKDKYILSQPPDCRSVEDMSVLTEDTTIKKLGNVHIDERPQDDPLESIDESVFSVILEENEDASKDDFSIATPTQQKVGIPTMFDSRKSIHSEESTTQTESEMLNLQFNGNTADVFPILNKTPNALDGVSGYDADFSKPEELTTDEQQLENDAINNQHNDDANVDDKRSGSIGRKKSFFGLFKRGLGMPARRSKRENNAVQVLNASSNVALPLPTQSDKNSNDANMTTNPTELIDLPEPLTVNDNSTILRSEVVPMGHTTNEYQTNVRASKNTNDQLEEKHFSKPIEDAPPQAKTRKIRSMLRTKSFESSDGESSKASKHLFGFLRRQPTKKQNNSSRDDVPLFAYMDSAEFSEEDNITPTLHQGTALHITDELPFHITNDDESAITPDPCSNELPNHTTNEQERDSEQDVVESNIENRTFLLGNDQEPGKEALDTSNEERLSDIEAAYIEKLRMEAGSVSEYDSDDDLMSHEMEEEYDSSVVPSFVEEDDSHDDKDESADENEGSRDKEDESEEDEDSNVEGTSSPGPGQNLEDSVSNGEDEDSDEDDNEEADGINSIASSQNNAESVEESDDDTDNKDESDASDNHGSTVSNDDSDNNASASSGVEAESLESADDESNSGESNSKNSSEADNSRESEDEDDSDENSDAEDSENNDSSKSSAHDIDTDKVVEFVDLSDMISVSSAMSNRVYGAKKLTETDNAGGDAMFEPFETDDDPVEDMTNMEIFTGFNFYASNDEANNVDDDDDNQDNDASQDTHSNSASSLEDEGSEQTESDDDEENSQEPDENESSTGQEEEDSEEMQSVNEESDGDGENEDDADNLKPFDEANKHKEVYDKNDKYNDDSIAIDSHLSQTGADDSPTRNVYNGPQGVNGSDSRPRPEQRRKSFLAAFGFGSRVDTEAVDTKPTESSYLDAFLTQPTVHLEEELHHPVPDEASTAYDVEEVMASNAIVQDEPAPKIESNKNHVADSIETELRTLTHDNRKDWDSASVTEAISPFSHEEAHLESIENANTDDDFDIRPINDDETVKIDESTDNSHKRGSNLFRFPFRSKKVNHSKLDDDRGGEAKASPYDIEAGDALQSENQNFAGGADGADLDILNDTDNGMRARQESVGHSTEKTSLGSFFNRPKWLNASTNSTKRSSNESNYTGREVINKTDIDNDTSIVMEQFKATQNQDFDQHSNDMESGYSHNNASGSKSIYPAREKKKRKSKDQNSSNLWCIIAVAALAMLGLVVGASLGAVVGRNKGVDSTEAPISTGLAPTLSPSMLRPTNSPVMHQTTYNVICEFLLDCSPLLDGTSPQGMAFQWINDQSINGFDINQQPQRVITRFALATLYYSTNGVSWVDATNWLSSSNECEWFSTSTNVPVCDEAGNFVTLALDNNNLYGKLPSEVALLNNLTSISIRNPADSIKSLYGRLDAIFQGVSGQVLSQLTSLSIVGNIFTGGIPSELNELKILRSLDLSNNDLRGYIPYTLDSMSGLEYVNLQNNRLTGGIPSEFCLGATNLIDLNLSGNIFTSVPESIDALTSLSRLNMAKNQFVAFPTPITRMLNLQSLDISDNSFGGPVPSSIGNMKSLQELYLRNNDLSGTIPESIGNLVQLSKALDLSQNRFTGPIPTSLSQLVQLEHVFLNANQLSGSLPEEFIRWNALEIVRLDENAFTGTIPILLCQEWSGIQSYADCSDFNISSTGSTVPSSCFTFCCQAKQCVCNYEVSDPLRCLG